MSEEIHTPRETQFLGFARLLWNELLQANGYSDCDEYDDPTEPTNYLEVIARRAYDLVEHAAREVKSEVEGNCTDLYQHMTLAEIMAQIPDLTEWPKEAQ